ncbi:MAG: efflux RND transporter permease subunit [bacterium]|nr:efflux RND transporter permease subunit [bacterium]
MIERVVDFSIRNKVVVFAATLALVVAGVWSIREMPLDAVPDLSDPQVIVFSRWDRSPDLVEDQVTYPIVTSLLGAPGVVAVRGMSDYGHSFVHVIFEDGTDMYWARSRVQEYLATVLPRLPEDAQTELGPDATGLGWVFQYALVDDSGTQSLAELRSVQDYYLRYHLRSVEGVAEIATVGGFEREYQIDVDPNRLLTYGIPIQAVVDAARAGNVEGGGRLVEFGSTEYMVRGRGYARSVEDIASIVVRTTEDGAPIRVRDVGRVTVGPALRRGVADLDGAGEVVSGIVVMRQGQNALRVIDDVRAKLREIEPGLPDGVSVKVVYDRSTLVHRAIDTLSRAIFEIVLTASLVIFLLLRHGPSAAIPIVTIPVAVIISFVPFGALGLTANIMSLGGIAIAIGALADAAIVVVDQTHKRLEGWQRAGRPGDPLVPIRSAILEVAGPSFFSLIVLAVAFIPVMTLEAQEGRLFKPLAYTKTLATVVAACLALTLDPALRALMTRMRPYTFRPRWLAAGLTSVLVGKIRPEGSHPVMRTLMAVYEPVLRWCLRHRRVVLVTILVLMAVTIGLFLQLGTEFMPPLDEGALFYMPTTMPGISVTEAQRLLQETDRVILGFPEVAAVLGKAGRADTATDPAPLSMLETVVELKPVSEWRRTKTWYGAWAPDWMLPALRRITPDHISREQLVRELNEALRVPGLSNAWTMPIKARIDMLSTGIRTPLGVKVSGADPAEIERIARDVERRLRPVAGTRTIFAERTSGGYFLDIRWKRGQLAQYGLTVEEAQRVASIAIGGELATQTVEGRERYDVRVRYLPDFRSDEDAIRRVLVPARDGRLQVPLGRLADVERVLGPGMLRNEDGLLTGYVYIDLAERDPASYVREADALLRSVELPPGYALSWSGQFEAIQRMRDKLTVVLPVTLLLILLLLYLNTRSLVKTTIVLLAVPFSAIGAVWLLWALDYNMSIAVWVGMIALLGVDAETGVFMLLYLDLAYRQARKAGRLTNRAQLREAVCEGAVRRLRPKFMTVATTVIGLMPILLATGAGSDVMKRIATPMIGGILTSFLLELLVYPLVYEMWKEKGVRTGDPA